MVPISQGNAVHSAVRKIHEIFSNFIAISLQAWPLMASATAFYLVCNVEQIQELALISQLSETKPINRVGQGILVLAVFCISFETCIIQWAFIKKNSAEQYGARVDFAHIYAAAAVSMVFPGLIWGLVGFRWPDLIAIALGFIYIISSYKSRRRIIALRSVFLVTLLILMLLGIRFTVVSPEAARAIGTIGLVAIGFFFLGETITLVFGLIPSVIRGKSAYLLLAPAALLLGILYQPVEEKISDNHFDLNSKIDILPSASDFTGTWLLGRQKQLELNKNSAIYIVIAEGGGIRSAYWTASALNALETESKGSFSKSTIAYSGISGGSIGIATFLACRSTRDPSRCIEENLGGDLLSPIVARLLFAEPIRLVLRGGHLLPRDDTFIAMLEDQSKSPQARAIWSSGNWVKTSDSALFFGSTDLHTGKRVTFSNIRSPDYGNNQDPSVQAEQKISPPIRNIVEVLKAPPKLSFAATASARFPGVSAPIRVDTHLLADGGYRENTGTEEIMPILEELTLLAKGRSNLTRIAWIETDVPMGMIHGSDSELVSEGVVSEAEVENLRVEIRRAIKLEREIRPLIESRPIRIILLRNTFSVRPNITAGPLTELRTALSGLLSARLAKTDDAIVALRSHVFRDGFTRGPLTSVIYSDSRYNEIPQDWFENPESFEKSEYVVSSFLTTTFTNDYCHGDRQPSPSDLVVLDLGKFVSSDMRVPLGWTLSSSTRAVIRQAAGKALGENKVSISGRYDVPIHVLENEDCASYYEAKQTSDIDSVR